MNQTSESIEEITMPVEGITCASCVARIEKNVAKLPGVKEVKVNLATERLKVLLDEQSSWKDVVKQVEKTGYSVRLKEIDLNIEGMTCASCVSRIEKVVGKLEGVQSVNVNLASEKAHIMYVPGVIEETDLIRQWRKPGITPNWHPKWQPMTRGRVSSTSTKGR